MTIKIGDRVQRRRGGALHIGTVTKLCPTIAAVRLDSGKYIYPDIRHLHLLGAIEAITDDYYFAVGQAGDLGGAELL